MLLETNILIEADGVFWHSSESVAERDAKKTALCIERGMILIRIKDADYQRDRLKALDVIITRWQNATGEKAVLDGSERRVASEHARKQAKARTRQARKADAGDGSPKVATGA